jgi:hypothetical protein
MGEVLSMDLVAAMADRDDVGCKRECVGVEDLRKARL